MYPKYLIHDYEFRTRVFKFTSKNEYISFGLDKDGSKHWGQPMQPGGFMFSVKDFSGEHEFELEKSFTPCTETEFLAVVEQISAQFEKLKQEYSLKQS